jgi:hypothetical protein
MDLWRMIGCNNTAFYQDSLGRPPPKEVKMNRYCKKWSYNSKKIQPETSILCGEYCLYVLYWWARGRHITDIISDFHINKNENEILVDLFCRSRFPLRGVTAFY